MPELVEVDGWSISTTYARHWKLALITVAIRLLNISLVVVWIPIPTRTPAPINHWVEVSAVWICQVLYISIALQCCEVRAVRIVYLRQHKHEWLTRLEVLVVCYRLCLAGAYHRVICRTLLDDNTTLRVVASKVVVSNLALLVAAIDVVVVDIECSVVLEKKCRVHLVVGEQLLRCWSLAIIFEHSDICNTPLDTAALLLNLFRNIDNNVGTLRSCALDVYEVVCIVVWSCKLSSEHLAIVVELGIRDSCYDIKSELLAEVKTIVAGKCKHRRTTVDLLTATEYHQCARRSVLALSNELVANRSQLLCVERNLNLHSVDNIWLANLQYRWAFVIVTLIRGTSGHQCATRKEHRYDNHHLCEKVFHKKSY